jgi:Crp-like helix-turn-helix domain
MQYPLRRERRCSKPAQSVMAATGSKRALLVRHRIRQDDLAALANVARENASRILSEWTARKVIAHPPPSVYLIDKAKLEREAGISS